VELSETESDNYYFGLARLKRDSYCLDAVLP
jgi:hypothetical protein